MDLVDKISDAIASIGIQNDYTPHANYWEFRTPDGEAISYCEFQSTQPISHIDLLEVEDNFQGKSLGKVMLQTISSHFDCEGAKVIQINKVENDGLSFWARYGAMPNGGAPEPSKYVSMFLPPHLLSVSRVSLTRAYERALQNREDAWYVITNSDMNVPRELIANLNAGSYKKSMTVDLSHEVVRERLGLD